MAAYMADKIIVMKHGEIVECGDRERLLKHAKTEYTRQLLDAVPSLGGMRYV